MADFDSETLRREISAVLNPLVQRIRDDSTLVQIIRPKDIFAFCGLRPTARDELVARGEFPKPIQLSDRAKGFLADEVAAWQRRKIAERDAKLAAKEQSPTPAPTKSRKRKT